MQSTYLRREPEARGRREGVQAQGQNLNCGGPCAHNLQAHDSSPDHSLSPFLTPSQSVKQQKRNMWLGNHITWSPVSLSQAWKRIPVTLMPQGDGKMVGRGQFNQQRRKQSI